MNGSIIIRGQETVPDLRGFAFANGPVGKTDDEAREAIGDKFTKHIYHLIVCIGALVAWPKGNCRVVEAMGAPHVGERTEELLISVFVCRIANLNPPLVRFNGNSLDLPVLRYSAMVNAVSAPGFELCDALSSFSSGARATLNEISRIMGMPGKPDGIDGGQVEKYFSEGTIREIAEYCESDVINTYLLWLRYGWRLTESAQQASELSLLDFIKRHENTKRRDMVAGPAP